MAVRESAASHYDGKAAQPQCVASTFEAVLPANASVEAVAAVKNGGSYGEGAANIAYPTNPTGLPELCAVTVRVASSPSSSYRFGLFLPTSAGWNSKFLAVGNGGFAGGINWLDMGSGPRYGFATVSTDTGHISKTGDLTWALQHPESQTDWGWRAMHGTVQLGKRLTEAYYGNSIAYSYYSGCSTGGRQGLKEVQISPNSFDGVLVGAPAWYTSHLNTWVTWLAKNNLPFDNPNHIPYTLFPAIGDEVVRQCDTADGVADGIVSAPELCKFDFSRIQCGRAGVSRSKCLTAAQIATAKTIYGDYRAGNGTWLYAGMSLGSEDQWRILLGGDEPSPFGLAYERFFLFGDPGWDWHNYNDSVVDVAARLDPGACTAADYGAVADFRDRGGKLIMYHGAADGLLPARGSTYYYEQTAEVLGDNNSSSGGGGAADDFFRYFVVPGMQHCWGSAVDAPWSFGAALQAGAMGTSQWSVPGFRDEDHDALLALQAWVERGRAVDRLVATTWRSSMNPASGVLRQRPVCPYPRKAVYDGEGDVDDAGSWACGS